MNYCHLFYFCCHCCCCWWWVTGRLKANRAFVSDQSGIRALYTNWDLVNRPFALKIWKLQSYLSALLLADHAWSIKAWWACEGGTCGWVDRHKHMNRSKVQWCIFTPMLWSWQFHCIYLYRKNPLHLVRITLNKVYWAKNSKNTKNILCIAWNNSE